MDVSSVAEWAGPAISALAAAGVFSVIPRIARSAFPDHRERVRNEIERDADLLGKLPESSDARQNLLASINDDVLRLSNLREARRDPMGIGLSVFFLVLTVIATWAAFQSDGWQRVLLFGGAGISALFTIVGFTQSAPQTLRDDKGNPTSPGNTDSARTLDGPPPPTPRQATDDRDT